MARFFNALMKLIQGLLLGNGKFEEVGYMNMVKEFLFEGLFSQFM